MVWTVPAENALRPGVDCEDVETARTVLNELRWRDDRDFTKVLVEYVHRGAPGDLATVEGPKILALEPWMIVIRREGEVCYSVPGVAAIPYHHILRILYGEETVFDRSGRRPGKA